MKGMGRGDDCLVSGCPHSPLVGQRYCAVHETPRPLEKPAKHPMYGDYCAVCGEVEIHIIHLEQNRDRELPSERNGHAFVKPSGVCPVRCSTTANRKPWLFAGIVRALNKIVDALNRGEP